jgi:hypothetical protein
MIKMEVQIIKMDDRIAEFKTALTAGMEGIVLAAKIFVETIDRLPESEQKFKDAAAEVPVKMWKMLEKIGRKQEHPRMIIGGMDVKKKKALKKLPYEIQEAIFDGKCYEVVDENGVKVNLSPLKATAEQVEQLCGDGDVRSISEQKKYLSKSHKETPKVVELPRYDICGGRVTFRKGVTLSREEVEKILGEM